MPRPERAFALGLAIDEVHHRRIGGEEDAPLRRLLGHEIDRRRIRQMGLESPRRLVHEADAVGKEQDALHPAGAHHQVDQRDDRARLARAGRHDEQALALVVFLEALGQRPDRPLLIRPANDLAVDGLAAEHLPAGPSLDRERQLVPLVEAADLARAVARIVPDPVFVAV